MLKIGVLSLQGAIEEHEEALRQAAKQLKIELQLSRVILQEDLQDIDGIVMPGGESSAMKLIGKRNGMLEALSDKLEHGLPTFGTCAGAILLSKRVKRNPHANETSGAFPLLDVLILRNGYGRQVDSFSINLDFVDQGPKFKGVFIRAPVFQEIGPQVESLITARGHPVFIKQGNIYATSFHPELTSDSRIHQLFLHNIKTLKEK